MGTWGGDKGTQGWGTRGPEDGGYRNVGTRGWDLGTQMWGQGDTRMGHGDTGIRGTWGQ